MQPRKKNGARRRHEETEAAGRAQEGFAASSDEYFPAAADIPDVGMSETPE